jgi:uncharacterized protein YihD (DUF1040 family)
MPRDPKRIEPMLDLIRDIWTKRPDLRLTQILVVAMDLGGEAVPRVFHYEDTRLYEDLKKRFPPDAKDYIHPKQ